MLIIINQ